MTKRCGCSIIERIGSVFIVKKSERMVIIMQSSTWKRISVLLLAGLLATGMLAGCGNQSEEQQTETQQNIQESIHIPEGELDTQYSDPVIETEEESEETQIPTLEPEPEEEQVKGEDYELDVPVMALEVGIDESHMTLVWEATWMDGEIVRIWKVGAEDDYLDYGATLAESEDKKVRNYVADIFGLEAGTRYGYKVGREDEWSMTHYFATKHEGPSFEFLAAGDPQIGTGDTYEDGEAWKKALTLMTQQTGSANFLLNLGDAVDVADNKYQYDLFMEPEELKSIAVASIVGNHDRKSPYYTSYFAMPNLDVSKRGANEEMGEGSQDYSFTYGDTLFLCLNSNNTDYEVHKSFMADAINQYAQAKGVRPRWIIAAMHHSIYSITDHLDSPKYYERQEAMAPMFSELGVDVVLMGHDHSHARTYPMNGTVPDVVKNEDGSRPTTLQAKQGQTVYFTLNSSTGSKYYEQVDIGSMIAFNNQEEIPNMTKITVRKDKLIFTTCRIEEEASILEEFTLYHRP